MCMYNTPIEYVYIPIYVCSSGNIAISIQTHILNKDFIFYHSISTILYIEEALILPTYLIEFE